MVDIFKTIDLQFRLQATSVIDYPNLSISGIGATFIVGESGCGKSSLLRLFNATISPSQGQILYNNKDIAELDTIQLRREAVLANQSVFLFDETIQENFDRYYEIREQSIPCVDKIKEYLSICCADFPLDTKCSSMSGGERQRVFISICLSFIPRVLMLDEPTSALDEKTANSFMQNIKYFCNQAKTALIVVSHDKALTNKFADNIIVLEKSCKSIGEGQIYS